MTSFQLARLTVITGCLQGAWLAHRTGSEARDVQLMSGVGGVLGLVCLSSL